MDDYVTGVFWMRLLNWHIDNERLFPWRNTRNPYYVLVAEVLLQQTRAEQAQSAYTAFVQRFPSVGDLAHAELHALTELIRPIGLAYRASQLKTCASKIVSAYAGQIPTSRSDLLGLPDVGPYIADAVLCYAVDQPTVPIDTNVVRVMSRFFDLRISRSEARRDKALAQRIRAGYPKPTSRRENLAVLDFAALVCTARKPKCASCFLAVMCATGQADP